MLITSGDITLQKKEKNDKLAPYPIPVMVTDDNNEEGYVLYVESSAQWENDIWTVCLTNGGIVRHYNTSQIRVYKNATFEIKTKEEKAKKEQVIIDIKGKKLKVINIETTYVGVDGKPLRSSEYLELLIGVLGRFYNDEQTLRDIWSNPKNRKELLEKLKDMNIDESQLEDLKDIFEAKNSDIYDVLAHLSFNHNIKTRDERAIAALNSKFIEKYQNEKAKDFIEFILEKYRKYGFKELEENKLSTLIEQSGFDRRELMASFGDFKIRDEYFELQKEIYR